MDRLAITGVLIAIITILGGYVIEGGVVSALFHLPAFLIVFGGSIGAVMLQTPQSIFVQGVRDFRYVWKPVYPDFKAYQQKIHIWSEVSRQRGFLPLENHLTLEEDPFVKKALSMLIDGVDQDVMVESLELEIELQSERDLKAANIYEAMGGYSPTIGIIGAVLGLIQAMGSIDEPTALGSGIATAFVATIYGVGSANLLFIPCGQKLKAIVEERIKFQHQIVQGMVSLSNGDNPLNISRKLSAFNNVQ